MHPLQTYLRNLKIAATDLEDFTARLKHLADASGTSPGVLIRLHYPKQTKLSPTRALRLELATNGQVPASSVSRGVGEVMRLVDRVLKMRENNKIAGG